MRDARMMFAIILVLICILLGALGQVVWKQGMLNMEKINNIYDVFNPTNLLNIFSNKYIISGLILYGLAFILWLSAMSTLDIAFMYPMLSLAYVITAIIAFLFLGEHISTIRWLGIISVVFGCFLIAKG
jgi:drug/metabolite transporter (DMT)-like permease